MWIPTSASPNSTSPRSSRRLTIARARNSIWRMPVDMQLGAAILHGVFDGERGAEAAGGIRKPFRCRLCGEDASDADGGEKRFAAVDAQHFELAAMDRGE